MTYIHPPRPVHYARDDDDDDLFYVRLTPLSQTQYIDMTPAAGRQILRPRLRQ